MYWHIINKTSRKLIGCEYACPSAEAYPNCWFAPYPNPTHNIMFDIVFTEQALDDYLEISWGHKVNYLLREYDKTILEDSKLTGQEKQACKDYRTALRNILITMTDPKTVVWPIPPTIPIDV